MFSATPFFLSFVDAPAVSVSERGVTLNFCAGNCRLHHRPTFDDREYRHAFAW